MWSLRHGLVARTVFVLAQLSEKEGVGMTGEERLNQKYLPVARMSGSELLLSHDDALKFIEDCRNLGLVILGMDFFKIDGRYNVALVNPADYSALSEEPDAVEKTAAEALKLIGEKLPNDADVVTFVVAEPKV